MKVTDKMAFMSVAVILITMPVSGQYVLEGLDWVFMQMFSRGTFVTVGAAVYLMGYIMWKMYETRERVNIPVKPSKVRKIPVTIN